MVDNFDIIYDYINGLGLTDKFYFPVTIRKRRKDKGNELMERGEKTIKTYYIESYQQLNYYKDEMIQLANMFNARIYINLNPKPANLVNYNLQLEYSKMVFNKTNRNPQSVLESVIFNTVTPRKYQTLMFDIDENGIYSIDDVVSHIEKIFNTKNWYWTDQAGCLRSDGDVKRFYINSLSGKHLIVAPFNRELFNQRVKTFGIYDFSDESNEKDTHYYLNCYNVEAFGIKENSNVLLYANIK